MKQNDLLWLAGLLEGEGSFGFHHKKYPRIALVMTDEDIVQRAAQLMDTVSRSEVRKTTSGGTVYRCDIAGPKAVALMRDLLPLMGKRRTIRILELIQSFELENARRGGMSHAGPRKISAQSVLIIRELYKRGLGVNKIAEIANMSHQNIGSIIRRRSWKHI